MRTERDEGRGTENHLHGCCGRHPTDAPANGFVPQGTAWVAAGTTETLLPSQTRKQVSFQQLSQFLKYENVDAFPNKKKLFL